MMTDFTFLLTQIKCYESTQGSCTETSHDTQEQCGSFRELQTRHTNLDMAERGESMSVG